MGKTLTYDNILAELKDVPANRLEELYSYVHSLASRPASAQNDKERIMSYFGILRTMPADEYKDFLDEALNARTNLFNRKIEL